jgi:hypothetical protein
MSQRAFYVQLLYLWEVQKLDDFVTILTMRGSLYPLKETRSINTAIDLFIKS